MTTLSKYPILSPEGPSVHQHQRFSTVEHSSDSESTESEGYTVSLRVHALTVWDLSFTFGD